MKKLVIVGCGRLAEIVADAVVNGLLPDYDLVGVYSRTASKAERIVTSRPLKSILLSDIQQYNYQTSIVNLQVFVSLGIETCRFL